MNQQEFFVIFHVQPSPTFIKVAHFDNYQATLYASKFGQGSLLRVSLPIIQTQLKHFLPNLFFLPWLLSKTQQLTLADLYLAHDV